MQLRSIENSIQICPQLEFILSSPFIFCNLNWVRVEKQYFLLFFPNFDVVVVSRGVVAGKTVEPGMRVDDSLNGSG